MPRACIAGLGHYAPSRVLTNQDLEQMVETSDAWITERTGVKERRIAGPGEQTSDLAVEASREACRRAGVAPADLDAILLATVTPDMKMPATAVLVQKKLGAGPCPALDLSAACAGFLFALSLAEGLIAVGRHRRVLVVGVEVLSREVDYTDRNTCVLFGDAAGAAVIVPSDSERGLLRIALHSDGRSAMDLFIPGGGSMHPASAESLAAGLHKIHMNGRAIFSQAIRNMSAASRAVLVEEGLGPEAVTHVFAHQANLRILEGVSQRTGIPFSRFQVNLDRYGNTSSASIPLGLSEAQSRGDLREGDLLLLAALGAGVSWGAALIRW